jgi:hypothetical protein
MITNLNKLQSYYRHIFVSPAHICMSGSFYLVFFLVSLACTSTGSAQELEPRTYSNTPIDINLVTVGFAYSSGNVLLDPTLPIKDLDGKLNVALAGYVRTFGLLGKNAKFKAFVPYAYGDWEGTVDGISAERDAQGFGDIRLKLEWNFYGAPALNTKEFRSWQQKTIVGSSVLLVTPTSDYNGDKLLNLGSNRWAIRPEIGVSKGFGKWTLELLTNVWLFGDNNNYFGGRTLEQNPLYVAKGHAIYTFRLGFWLGVGLGYGRGGQAKVDGVPRATEQENYRFSVHAAYPLNKNHGIVASYGSAENNGAGTEFDVAALRYQFTWGGL